MFKMQFPDALEGEKNNFSRVLFWNCAPLLLFAVLLKCLERLLVGKHDLHRPSRASSTCRNVSLRVESENVSNVKVHVQVKTCSAMKLYFNKNQRRNKNRSVNATSYIVEILLPFSRFCVVLMMMQMTLIKAEIFFSPLLNRCKFLN